MVSVYDPIRGEEFNYTWDEAGALSQTGTAKLTWDDRGRLSQLVWADGDGIAFTYDARGRRLSKTTFNQQGEGRQTATFHYLAGSNQVLYEEGPDGRLDYTYDSQGQRLSISVSGTTYWYIYNGHGDVVGLVDAQGHLAGRYEYDDYGRIVHMWGTDGSEVREGQGQIHYLNGDVTVGEVSPASATATSADGATAVTTDGTAATDGAALTGDATTSSATDGGTGTTATGNGNGNGPGKKVTSTTDTGSTTTSGKDGGKGAKAQGSVDAQATTDATTTVEIVKINPYRYAGYRYDAETELYFLESRYYDSWSNRFVSRDSYGGENDQPLTLNRYVYAMNNPLNKVDSDGHKSKDAYFDTLTDYVNDPPVQGSLVVPGYGLVYFDGPRYLKLENGTLVTFETGTPAYDKIASTDFERVLRHNLQVAESVFQEYRTEAPEMDARFNMMNWFLYNFSGGQKYDLKVHPKWGKMKFIWRGHPLDGRAIGNINYGFVARHFYSAGFEKFAGGVQQTGSDIIHHRVPRNILNWRTFGDDPVTARSVDLGIQFYEDQFGNKG